MRLTLLILAMLAYFGPKDLCVAKTISFYEIKSGVGMYRDVQLPINSYGLNEGEVVRADGSSASKDNGEHIGAPIEGSFTLRWFTDRYSVDGHLRYITLKHLLGEDDASTASYSRISFSLKPAYKYKINNLLLRGGFGLSYNSSRFLNVSSGHAINAVMFGPFVQFGSLDFFRLEAEASFAPNPEFNYLRSIFDFDAIARTESKQSIYKIEGAKSIGNSLVGLIGYELDQVSVTVRDIFSYEELGLQLSPYQDSSNNYILNTHTFTLGVRKVFDLVL